MGFSDSPEDLYIFMNALKKQCHTVQQESERRVSDECLPNPIKKWKMKMNESGCDWYMADADAVTIKSNTST